MRIGIAGAGLLGRLLAFELSALGHEVHVHDPAPGPQPPCGASPRAAAWSAAGMLSPFAEIETGDERLARWGLRSMERWQALVPRLPHVLPVGLGPHAGEQGGCHGAPPGGGARAVDFRREGSLLLAHREDLGSARRLLSVMAARLPGTHRPAQPLDREALARLEPAVHGPAHAWLLPGEGQIHPVEALEALYRGGCAQGVRWHWASPVRRVDPGALWLDAAGECRRHDLVFDVRGLGARPQCPVRGVRGEVFWLHAPGVALRRPLRLLHPRWRVYLVPRPGDGVVVGATEIESEDLSPVSVRSALGLLSAAYSAVPALAEARIVHSETNLRPALPDNLPALHVESGLVRINGLFRHGWLLAPALVEEALQCCELLSCAEQSSSDVPDKEVA